MFSQRTIEWKMYPLAFHFLQQEANIFGNFSENSKKGLRKGIPIYMQIPRYVKYMFVVIHYIQGISFLQYHIFFQYSHIFISIGQLYVYL